jgi:hypothetical protein
MMNSDFKFMDEKSGFNNKESYHWIEKRILYKMNYIFMSNTENLANYFEKNVPLSRTLCYSEYFFLPKNSKSNYN